MNYGILIVVFFVFVGVVSAVKDFDIKIRYMRIFNFNIYYSLPINIHFITRGEK